jgi:hypothetical protein
VFSTQDLGAEHRASIRYCRDARTTNTAVAERTQIAGDQPRTTTGAPQVTRVPTGPFGYEARAARNCRPACARSRTLLPPCVLAEQHAHCRSA